MPELPEVETTVVSIRQHLRGRRILKVWCDAPKLVRRSSFSVFSRQIRGARVLDVTRRAKNILIFLDRDRLLLVHQKMTGHFLIGKWRVRGRRVTPLSPKVLFDRVNGYIHLIFYLDDGTMLGLSDLRKFAKVILGSRHEILALPELADLGPEPLHKSFTFSSFFKTLEGQKRKVKQVLMDPYVIAGIGNIYADEILWAAKIYPARPAGSLTLSELKKIYKAMRRILKEAVRLGGTSVGDYRTPSGKEGGYASRRAVYGREGEKCPCCGTVIRRITMGGRSAHFCETCQRAPL